MKHSAVILDEIVRQRRSMRVYDDQSSFDHNAVQRSLERAVLSPNSSNMQLWEFYRVINPEKKALLAKYCMNQRSAITAREIIVIVTRRDKWKPRRKFLLTRLKKDFDQKTVLTKREMRALKYYGWLMPILYFTDWFGLWGLMKKVIVFFISICRPIVWEVGKDDVRVVVHKSAALAAQTFMLSMKAEGYDTNPMEGMDSTKIKRLLMLPVGAEINMVIGCGPGTTEGIYNERIRVNNDEVIFSVG